MNKFSFKRNVLFSPLIPFTLKPFHLLRILCVFGLFLSLIYILQATDRAVYSIETLRPNLEQLKIRFKRLYLTVDEMDIKVAMFSEKKNFSKEAKHLYYVLGSVGDRIGRVVYSNSSVENNQNQYKHEILNPPILANHHLGMLQVYAWYEICDHRVHILSLVPGFPYNPQSNYKVSTLTIINDIEFFGQRIFGFLIPPETGYFRFAVSADDSAQVWLSSDWNPMNSQLIAYVGEMSKDSYFTQLDDFWHSRTQQSNLIKLYKDVPYYLEVLHMNGREADFLQVVWCLPDTFSYLPIPSSAFALSDFEFEPSTPYPIHKQYITKTRNKIDKVNIVHLPFYPEDLLKPSFIICDPIYSKAYPRPIAKYTGWNKVPPLEIYPDNSSYNDGELDQPGNAEISQEEVDRIVTVFYKKLKFQNSNLTDYFLLNIEKFSEPGSLIVKYLVELAIKQKHTNITTRVSETVLVHNDNVSSMCRPSLLQWRKNSFVHIVITNRNQGRWILYFINNMERIYQHTKDENFGVVIVDFNSEDIDVEAILKSSKLKNWILIQLDGQFNKVQAQNVAIGLVNNPHDIIFTCDLHVDMPLDFVDTIRKRTLKGLAGFAPVLLRLSCGKFVSNPEGYWEEAGFGLFSMYRSDWINIGGMNVKEYAEEWGGEDWDLVDRVMRTGYDIERLKVEELYHFYHSKLNMWSNN